MKRGRRDSVAFTVVVAHWCSSGPSSWRWSSRCPVPPGRWRWRRCSRRSRSVHSSAASCGSTATSPSRRNLLVAGLLWGAFAATGAAIVFQGLGLAGGATERDVLSVVAPVTEEVTKGAFLFLLLWWRRHELDGVLDGIVYAGMVGVGFAYTENILYLAAAYDGTDGLGPGGTTALTSTFIVRCLISPFAHPFFTAFVGIGVGLAIASRRTSVRLLAPVVGLALAALLHGVSNSSTVSGTSDFLVVYGTLMFPVFLGVVAFAVYRRRSERPLLAQALQDAADLELLPAADIPWLVDLRARRHARRWARRRAARSPSEPCGVPGRRHRDRLLHRSYLRGAAPCDFSLRGQERVEELGRIPPLHSFPDRCVPTR